MCWIKYYLLFNTKFDKNQGPNGYYKMYQLIRLLISNLFQNFLILISNLKFIWKTNIYCISNMNSINFKNSKFWNQIESETPISKFWNSSDSNDD